MAGLSSASGEQLRAIAMLRWRLLVNALRSVRGRLNLVSRGLATLLVAGAGIGGGIALGSMAWGITREGNLELLAIPLWIVFLFWQLFPVMATAFNENVDTSSLLRFPLSYPAYFLIRLIFGALDIATALGLLWSLGLLIGISAADFHLAPWALLVIGSFTIFNILFARMIFVLIEHWLSRRRSREVLGVVFLLMMVGFQIAGPVLGRYSKKTGPERFLVLQKLIPVERVLPPGAAASVLLNASRGHLAAGILFGTLLACYSAGAFWILNLRLRDQYSGENSSGGEKRRSPDLPATVQPGWRIPILRGPTAALYEKELHYFSRSGPMLFTMVMPLVMVFVLWGGRKAFMPHQMGFVFPVGAAYCLLVLTNIVYNSFGGEGGGIQFLFVSPVSFRRVAIAKNLAQLTVLALDVSILWLGVRAIYNPPTGRVLVFTLAWYFFAVPLNLAVGNWLSVYTPKRIDYATFGRQRAAESTILLSLLVQFSAIATGAGAIFIGKRFFSSLWASSVVLLVLALPSIVGYFVVLGRIDRIAQQRREVLTTELCRA